MRYGYFDDKNKEYVIDRVNTPVPWTNYIGVNDMCAVLSQTAEGYVFYKSPHYHRITRFLLTVTFEPPLFLICAVIQLQYITYGTKCKIIKRSLENILNDSLTIIAI